MNPISVERCAGYQVVTMRWTAEHPGFEAGTFDEVSSIVEAADRAPEIAATVFVGAQRCFCLGSDVSSLLTVKDLDVLSETALRFFRALIHAQKPLIAAVDGRAVGLGLTMLCHFDVVFATPRSSFHAPFVDWGLTPEAGATLLLPQLVGQRKAFELFCLGGELGADEALLRGLLTRIVPVDELLNTTHEAARRLARMPCQSLRKTRDLLRGSRAPATQRAGFEVAAFRDLLRERSTQRRLQIMARALRQVLAA